jgi:type IV pilus assembly protein PilB
MEIGRKKLRLGDMLVQGGFITQDQLEMALRRQKETGLKLGEVLVDYHVLTEEKIAEALGEQLHLEVIELGHIDVPEEIRKLTSASLLKKHRVFPFEFAKDSPNVLRVAMADPMDFNAIDDLGIITNLQIEPCVSTTRQIMLAIDRVYGQEEVNAILDTYTREKGLDDTFEDEKTQNADVNSSPIVQLVKDLVENAVRQRASDIHIEPLEKRVRVRFRIDGVLVEKASYNPGVLAAVSARIKIISGMDIAEKRKPQDGRMTQVVDRQEYDIRVAVLPTVYGEKIVLRLASKNAFSRNKSQLGLQEHEMALFDNILKNPHGILLVTGPTGSGKSTTLYTALSELNKQDVNIITVEDPVEANIDGVNQVQVNPKADLTFATSLRSILRQDPDIIMIGEIRDEETAAIAVQAAITGHLVVSTLHTNSAAATVTRLTDMGIEPYLIADALVGVIAQRLVRRLCPNCKRRIEADYEKKKILKKTDVERLEIYEAVGCSHCDNSGYIGRIGVYEIMPMTNRVKRLIADNATSDEIQTQALSDGMRTLRMTASELVLKGITSFEEMMRVSFEN